MSFPHVDCPSCKNFAWHGDFQRPVVKDGRTHHPDCKEIASGVVTTRTGFYARRAIGGSSIER